MTTDGSHLQHSVVVYATAYVEQDVEHTAASVVAGGESKGDGSEANQRCSGSSNHHLQAHSPPGRLKSSPPSYRVSADRLTVLLSMLCVL